MRSLLQISALLLITAAATAAYIYFKTEDRSPISLVNFKGTGRSVAKKEKDAKELVMKRLNGEAENLESYASRNGYNEKVSFLVDMSLHSGSERFFVFNMEKDSIELAGLVTHGYGSISSSGLKFSNVPGSNATSLGRYKIGKNYMGRFGLAYKLHGLDKTNDKAFERFVVLHAHDCVPEAEVPYSICESQGCPTVSPAFLQTLKRYIDGSQKPILLEIYK